MFLFEYMKTIVKPYFRREGADLDLVLHSFVLSWIIPVTIMVILTQF